jgi:hypothetical protein
MKMKNNSFYLILILLQICFAHKIYSQESKADAWLSYELNEQKFRIKFPDEPQNEPETKEFKSKENSLLKIKIDKIGATEIIDEEKETAFGVITFSFDFEKIKIDDKKKEVLLEELEKNLRIEENVKVVKTKNILVNQKYKAKYIKYKVADFMFVTSCFFEVDNRFYQLIILNEGKFVEQEKENLFFDSFEILKR